jgi:hypothetical protein
MSARALAGAFTGTDALARARRTDRAHDRSRRPVVAREWTGGQNDTDGFGLAAQPDQSQGRPSINTGSQPIYQRAACPYLVLPEKPLFRYAGRYDHRRTDPWDRSAHNDFMTDKRRYLPPRGRDQERLSQVLLRRRCRDNRCVRRPRRRLLLAVAGHRRRASSGEDHPHATNAVTAARYTTRVRLDSGCSASQAA